MKCFNHESDANVVCMHCGKGLCKECASFTDNNRAICSDECKNALIRTDTALEMIHVKSENAIKINGYIYYVVGMIFLLAEVLAFLFVKDIFLSIFLTLFGASSVFAGYKTFQIYSNTSDTISSSA